MKPCSACPWIQKGQPDITPELRQLAQAGTWFCCHVNMGTCHGAAKQHASEAASPSAPLSKQPSQQPR